MDLIALQSKVYLIEEWYNNTPGHLRILKKLQLASWHLAVWLSDLCNKYESYSFEMSRDIRKTVPPVLWELGLGDRIKLKLQK